MSPGQQFCKNCGTMLCPHCREPLPEKSRYCPKCGFLCVTEQYTSTTQSRPTTSARPQAAAVPIAQTPPSRPAPQAAMHRQPPAVTATGSQHSCPRCGASIDTEMGRCTGCGLLYKGKPRIVQQAVSATPPPRPPVASSPQYRGPVYSPPYSGSGQRPSYVSPGTMPHGGMQTPVPRVAPATASTTSMQAGPYPYETVPPVPRGRGVSGAGKGGLIRGITIMFIVIVCLFVGGGIYYFVNQEGTPAPSNDTVDIMPPSIQVSTPSITETGATISWGTDEPTRGKVEYWKTETDVLTRLDENLSTSHSVTLSELEPNTTYYFKITSTDATENQATVEGNLTTLAAADETAPTISAVSSSSITESSDARRQSAIHHRIHHPGRL